MVRSQRQVYAHSPYRSPSSYQGNLSAISGLRQGLSSALQSVPVVVRNAPAVDSHSSDGSTVNSVEGEAGNHSHSVNGIVAERDLYYVPMPVGATRTGREGGHSALHSGPSDVRRTKRVHELDAENDGDMPRKHGKRLTTKEEVSLFEICNRHADSFGKRSDICNWWKTIAAEFTHAHGRPYSWHSVRRKVEIVTKQRVKFLEDQRQRQREMSGANLVEDLMNPQWCAVLDTWIPTWQRWEEAEARRIAKRDEMIRRRSHTKPGDQWKPPDQTLGRPSIPSPTSPDRLGVDAGHSFPDDGTNSMNETIPMTAPGPAPNTTALHTHPFESPSIPAPSSVKLPPGFETMFSNPQPTRQPTPPAPSELTTQIAPDHDLSTNNRMVGAVLETLGKLNKHLDAASGNGSPDVRSSPMISALVQAASESTAQNRSPQEPPYHANLHPSLSIDLDRIKEELRQEMQAELRRELDRDRAALEEKLDSVQRTQEMILEMLRQEPV
ncbi:uncharacterized protein N7459_003973 [Penicillium hispanicum]|uniref:uncharacterized protein n=1 Tax=Penicillium hispanicum TaxID=1080232 RepID=UPI0025407A95|nr:uncharacterized protein N7459_003973 [Penicillium hispanicum]KAJ5584173.1 hypothetical protein N7459_003973 [Penicillium hispanicum]